MLTLDVVQHLGVLYSDQDKLDKAEQMYIRALAGYEQGHHHFAQGTAKLLSDLRRRSARPAKPSRWRQMLRRDGAKK